MNIVNLGIFAHIDAGKTTLTEQILYLAGQISSPGTIEEGTTESDNLKVEIERGISVFTSILQFSCETIHPDFRINLIDTPGHLDFRSQVEYVLPIIDIAVVVIDGSRGVESQTTLLHEQLEKYSIPEIFFINKLDKYSDNISDSLASIEEMLGSTPQIIFKEEDYCYIWKSPEKFSENDHLELIQWSEKYSELYLENPNNIYDISFKAMLEGIWTRNVFPILGGSAYYGQGVFELLEFIFIMNNGIATDIRLSDNQKNSNDVEIFKRLIHPELGRLTVAKTLNRIEVNSKIKINEMSYEINSLQRIFNQNFENVRELQPGDIFVTSDLNSIPIFNKGEDPSFSIVIEPEHSEDTEEMIGVLEELIWEDPSFHLQKNFDTGNWHIWGRGELHLEILRNRLEERFKKKYRLGNLFVARFERLKKMVKKLALEHTAFEIQLSSGKLVANLRDTADFSKQIAFEVSLPEKIHNAIESGFYEAMSHGNFNLEVLGALFEVKSYNSPKESSEATPALLKVAVVSGIRDAIIESTYQIGPISDLEIELMDGDIGNVLSLLQKREAKILNIIKKVSGKSLIIAQAGTENLLGFSGVLRNMTRGMGISYQKNSFSPENYIVFNEIVR